MRTTAAEIDGGPVSDQRGAGPSGEALPRDRNVGWLAMCAESAEIQARIYGAAGGAFVDQHRAAAAEAARFRAEIARLRGSGTAPQPGPWSDRGGDRWLGA